MSTAVCSIKNDEFGTEFMITNKCAGKRTSLREAVIESLGQCQFSHLDEANLLIYLSLSNGTVLSSYRCFRNADTSA